MHKNAAKMKGPPLQLVIIAFVLAVQINAQPQQQQRGPPPGYYTPQAHAPQQYKQGKPVNSGTNIMGWLGSQMAKFPGFRGYPRPPTHPKFKHAYLPPQSPYAGGGASINAIQGVDLSHMYFPTQSTPSIYSSPMSSMYSSPSVAGYSSQSPLSSIYSSLPSSDYAFPSSNSLSSSQQVKYAAPSEYSNPSTKYSFPSEYPSPQHYSPPQNYASSSKYSINLSKFPIPSSPVYASPPPPIPNNPMSPQNTIFQVFSPDGTSRFQSSPPPGYENFWQQAAASQPHSPPPPPPSTSKLVMQAQQQPQPQQPQQPQIIYQYQNAPGKQPLHASQSSGNIEVIPSKMVKYEKETLSTGHPEYQTAIDSMSASESRNYPLHYMPRPTFPTPILAEEYGYRGQQVQYLNDNLGTMFNGVSPQVAPIYELANLQKALNDQQQSMDTQADYSHQPAVSVPAPVNFQSQERDIQTSESNNQVHILRHGAEDGNPTFEVVADANAPTYDGGHHFDINQLISMIEPGAQVDPKDIVPEGQEDGSAAQSYDTFADAPQEGFQSSPISGIKNANLNAKIMNSNSDKGQGFRPVNVYNNNPPQNPNKSFVIKRKRVRIQTTVTATTPKPPPNAFIPLFNPEPGFKQCIYTSKNSPSPFPQKTLPQALIPPNPRPINVQPYPSSTTSNPLNAYVPFTSGSQVKQYIYNLKVSPTASSFTTSKPANALIPFTTTATTEFTQSGVQRYIYNSNTTPKPVNDLILFNQSPKPGVQQYIYSSKKNSPELTQLLQTGPKSRPLNDKPTDATSTATSPPTKIKFPDTETDTRYSTLGDRDHNDSHVPTKAHISSSPQQFQQPKPSHIIYHTVPPSISISINTNPNKHPFSVNSTNDEHDADFNKNHNYSSDYKAKPKANTGSTGALSLEKFPANPLFDYVPSKENEPFDVGDVEVEESRQVYQYAITVTPPSKMFEGDEESAQKNGKTRHVTRIVSSEILNSTNISVSPKKRNPVYQRKPL